MQCYVEILCVISYELIQALSAMLMPINGIDEKALGFKQSFLKSGGLK